MKFVLSLVLALFAAASHGQEISGDGIKVSGGKLALGKPLDLRLPVCGCDQLRDSSLRTASWLLVPATSLNIGNEATKLGPWFREDPFQRGKVIVGIRVLVPLGK